MYREQNFTITQPATTWTLTHNFGTSVNADVIINLNGVLHKSYPLSMVQDEAHNVLTITWSTAQSGSARVITVNGSPVSTSNPTWIPDDAGLAVLQAFMVTEGGDVLSTGDGDNLIWS